MYEDENISTLIKKYPVCVLIHWDGVQVPNTFYYYIRKMNEPDPSTVKILQGVYLCKNNDTARLLANMADDLGASYVLISKSIEQFVLDDTDIQRNLNFKNGLPKRGRPKKFGDKESE